MSDGCTCAKCVAACERIPGVFHPLEALRAIRAGYARRMMACTRFAPIKGGKRWAEREFKSLMPLALEPADLVGWGEKGYFRSDAMGASGPCTFLKNRRCEIHSSGFKPAECRATKCVGDGLEKTEARRAYLDPWDTRVGEIIVEIWKRELSKGDGI